MGDYTDECNKARKCARTVYKLANCDLHEYNEMLANGVSDEVLGEETVRLCTFCHQAAMDYFGTADKSQGDFVRMGSLPFVVLEYNPVTPQLREHYDKTCILIEHVDGWQRELLKVMRLEVASACQLAYDEVIYSH